jgi:hypothetical protein
VDTKDTAEMSDMDSHEDDPTETMLAAASLPGLPVDGAPATAPAIAAPDERRIALLQRCEADAFAKPHATQAALAVLTAGLVDLAFCMNDAIRQNMSGSPLTLEGIQRLQPAIDLELRLARQIDRFSQLEQRALAVQRTSTASEAHRSRSSAVESLFSGRRPQ